MFSGMKNKAEKMLLKSKFRGCLLGSLVGDCYGAPFEGNLMFSQKKILQEYFDKLESPDFINAPKKLYTDDTAMTKSVAKCLIEKSPLDFSLMARLFVKEYFTEPNRGYGQNVVEVFHKLRNSKFKNVFEPAREQFSGSGSYGNGGAMRIAPIALYFHENFDNMLDAAKNVTAITHTNISGINGALLQAMAIQQTLLCETIDIDQFILQLIDKIKGIEAADKDEYSADENPTPYQTQLNIMKNLITSKYDDEYDVNVIEQLGNSISALYSVPTAIFCFLRAQEEIPGIKTNNAFRRTVQYAISLGGDTDTIASMAGALAGAYFGEEFIDKNLLKHCEFYKETLEIADDLFTAMENYHEICKCK